VSGVIGERPATSGLARRCWRLTRSPRQDSLSRNGLAAVALVAIAGE